MAGARLLTEIGAGSNVSRAANSNRSPRGDRMALVRELFVSSRKVRQNLEGPPPVERASLARPTLERSPPSERAPRNEEIGVMSSQAEEILVEVRDSGPGLDPEHLNRLFEAFYTTKPQGLGIGLTISRTIAEAHGGRLWAEPNEPRGAVFQLALPVRS